MNKKPVHVVRLGLIKGAIWHSQTRHGERHNVTFTRIFKDGDVWRESNHFGRDDLQLLAKVADMTHTWIHLQGGAVETTQEQ